MGSRFKSNENGMNSGGVYELRVEIFGGFFVSVALDLAMKVVMDSMMKVVMI